VSAVVVWASGLSVRLVPGCAHCRRAPLGCRSGRVRVSTAPLGHRAGSQGGGLGTGPPYPPRDQQRHRDALRFGWREE